MLGISYDLPTLLVAVTLANAFCAGARFMLWRFHPGIPGLAGWALSGGVSILVFILLASYESNFWSPILSFAQSLAVLALCLTWDGVRRFVGRAALSHTIWIVIAAVTLLWVSSPQFYRLSEARAMGNAVLVAVLSALIARELFSVDSSARSIRATGWVFAVNAAIFTVRILMAEHGNQTADPLNPDGFADFMLLWWLCTTIAITLGMVLMTAERLQADLNNQANRDPLTGALNRRSFALFTEKVMAQSRRYNNPLSVMIMDLDDFKQINDRLGHEMGDNVLCGFVSVADRALRTDDIFCRYGGEEFVALLPNTSAKRALIAAERLRTTLAAGIPDMKGMPEDQPITVSIGIAELGQGEDFDSLLRRADDALYQAKGQGRNRCQLTESYYLQAHEEGSGPRLVTQHEN